MIKIQKKLIEIPIELFKNILIDTNIEFNDGIKIISKDPANVCMCLFEISKDKFINYELNKPEKVNINLELLDKIIKRIKTEFIIFKIEDNQLIILDDKNKKQFNMVISEETENEKTTLPDLTFTSNIEIKSKELQELFLDASMVSDCFKMQTKENKVIINAGEQNKYNCEFENIVDCNDFATYSLEYINKFMNASKYFENVKFEFSTESPCKLSFKNENLEIQFILAPRVSEY